MYVCCCCGGSFDRIKTTPGKGVAACYPPERQKSSPDGAVFGDSLNRVLGTGRDEAAGRGEKRRNKVLVPLEYCDQTAAGYLAPSGSTMCFSGKKTGVLFTRGHHLLLPV